MKPNPIPDNYNTITAYLTVHDCTAAIQYYVDLFAAQEGVRFDMPGGKIGHAELHLGDSKIMLSDEYPEMGVKSPKHYGGSPVSLSIYVEDVDATFQKAIQTGSKSIKEVEKQFHGDRSGQIEDPFGYKWTIASRVEEVSEEEMQKRAKELFG